MEGTTLTHAHGLFLCWCLSLYFQTEHFSVDIFQGICLATVDEYYLEAKEAVLRAKISEQEPRTDSCYQSE